MKDEPYTISYLLRLWLVGDLDRPQWRASLKDVRTGERNGFPNLEALFGYLTSHIDPQKIAVQVEKERKKT